MTRWLVILFLLWPAFALAGLTDDFQEAAELYDAGNFAVAAAKYQAIIDKGYSSAELHYNLGCARFKAGELGRAIASFRRAQRLVPDDEDVKINSQFARLFVVDKIDTAPARFFPDQVETFLSKFHPNHYFWLALVSFALMFLILALRRLGITIKPANTLATFLMVVTILATVSMVWVLKVNYLVNEGVIVVSETEVLSGPGSEFELQFDAHEGLTFRVLDQKSDCYLGLFANKLKGWVKIADVERI
ncbi:MAG: tetratricopeptide repeat protein [candidate division Zixibacteria bacterium]|nr:tetratricopeptide repeat protein [candidate division Zixibacteria bacterium]